MAPQALSQLAVGKVASVVAVTAALAVDPRCVISVGSAGALHAGFRVGDVVLADAVLQHDFAAAEADGFRLFGYGAEIPSMGDPLLAADEGLVAAAFGAAALGFAAFLVARKSVFFGVLVGELVFLAGAWWFGPGH